jgi:serine/threonine protein kinase
VLALQALKWFSKMRLKKGNGYFEKRAPYDKLQDFLQLSARLDHPNVVRAFEVIEDDAVDDFFLGEVQHPSFLSRSGVDATLLRADTAAVQEYVDMGQLMHWEPSEFRFHTPLTRDGRMDEALCKQLFCDIVAGLDYCTWRGLHTVVLLSLAHVHGGR